MIPATGSSSMRSSCRTLYEVAVVLLAGMTGALWFARSGHTDPMQPSLQPRSYEERTGSVFLLVPKSPLQAPSVRELRLPPFADATSVWGATGRDLRGRIWLGVSAQSSGMSAHLFQYDPEADAWHDRGAVVVQLQAAGLYRQGEGQIKIHSKIIVADDGWLYFASTDEDGEHEDGTVLPRWGGHLWRLNPDNARWQHLLAVPEGLVAVSGVGRYVYALGYWGHVLYQYDTATGKTKRTVVGSVGGHVSRNFLADVNGHVYVPRVTMQRGGKASAALVEYDSDLQELVATPLHFYLGPQESAKDNHGIVGLAYLADGHLVFTTHRGHLYLIELQHGSPAKVTAIGWFHPKGETYTPSLFALDGHSLLAGVTQRGSRFEWVVFALQTRRATALPLDTKGMHDVLLYGSVSRDHAGRFYVGGWAANQTGGQRPLVLQLNATP